MLLPLQLFPSPGWSKSEREGGPSTTDKTRRARGCWGALGTAGNAAGSQQGADVTENKQP